MHHKRRSRRRAKGRMAPCGCCEIVLPNKEPIADGSCMGKTKKKKPRPKKERCPVNRTHEWYKEVVVTTRKLWYYWPDMRAVKKTERVETCIHCWKERRKTLDVAYIR